MVAVCADSQLTSLDYSAEQAAAIALQASRTSLDSVLAGLDILQTAKYRLRGNAQPHVVLETALVRLSRLDQLVSLSELSAALRGDVRSDSQPTLNSGVAARPIAAAREQAGPIKKKSADEPELAADAPQPLTEIGRASGREKGE